MFKENLLLFSSKFVKQKDYWIKKLSGDIVETELLIGNRKNLPSSPDREKVEIDLKDGKMDLSHQLIKLSKQTDTGLYIILLAGLKSLIYRYTGKEDIIVQAPVYKKKISPETINNHLFIRDIITGGQTFKNIILSVRTSVLEAHANQDYPFEKIIEYLFDAPQKLEDNLFSNIVCSLDNIHDRKNIEELKGKIAFNFKREEHRVSGCILYDSRVYHPFYVEKISTHFVRLLTQALQDVNLPLSGLTFITGEEKKQLLIDFNRTYTDYPSGKSVKQLFEEMVSRVPDCTAVVKVTYDVGSGVEKLHAVSVSYRYLNQRANQLARHLKTRGVVPGTNVAIMADHSLEGIVGLLGILKTGGAYLAVDPEYPKTRKRFMLMDSNAFLVLVQDKDIDIYTGNTLEVINLRSPGIFTGSGENLPHVNTGDDVAYLIYTSGSTGNPKGVLVEHKSVVRLVRDTNYIEFTGDTKLLQTGALEFDASTLEIWGCLLNGARLHLLNKNDILEVYTLRKTLEKFKINLIWLASGLFNQMFDCDAGMFNSLGWLVVGGDVLSAFRINQLRNRFPGIEVINGYGPTENTTFSACFSINRDYESNIPIGPPISNTRAFIMDRYYGLQPVGAAGHLCFSGDGLARGYLNNPEFTAEKFINNPLVPGERIYLTGDLARWLPDGIIEFLGRIDHQMKIRGYRIEPGEIENHLLATPGISECVVQIVQDTKAAGEKHLCAYVVADKEIDAHELRETLYNQLPDYMVPSFFLQLKEIPLTPNGKVDRRALPKPEIKAGDEYVPPRNEIEKKLVKIFAEVLNIDEEVIGIDSNFFDLGGHSLKAVSLIAKIHKELNIKIQLTEIFKIQTVRGLAKQVAGAVEVIHTAIEPVEQREYYPLSSAQKRMFILQQIEGKGTAYNVYQVTLLNRSLDKDRLQSVLQEIIRRHESLRTSFMAVDEEPVQRIYEPVEFEIEYHDLKETRGKSTAIKEIVTSFVRPFDLSQAPLLRIGFIIEHEARHVLMMDMHHIIADGTSLNRLLHDFRALYAGGELPGLRLQYKDYSTWQNSLMAAGELKKQEEFWLKEFETLPPMLVIPTDYPRPASRSFEGDSIHFELGVEETRELNILSKSNDATLFMTLLTAFNVLLFKLGGGEDIVVGTPVACRTHADLENIVGMFVNTLALRNKPKGEKSFQELLREVKEKTLEAFENQEYQLEDLVEQVTVSRDVSRNPIFDVSFGLENQDENLLGMNLEGVLSQHPDLYDFENLIAKFDLTLAGTEIGDALVFVIEYSTRLFKKSTIERFSNYFKRILTTIVENPQKKISGIDTLSSEERKQLLVEFNNTYLEIESPGDKTLHQLFAEQAARMPDGVAVVCAEQFVGAQGAVPLNGNVHLTYRELNEKSDQLAHLLGIKGVKPDTIVGIMVEPSIEMVIGILGILKAGGAYLPIDPEFPDERKQYMLTDSGAKVLLTNLSEGHHFHHSSFINHHSGNLAYVIYTSGTTGQPKGVMVDHRGVVNYTWWRLGAYNFKETDTALQLLSYCFDGFGANFYSPLLSGAAVVMLPSSKKLDFSYIKETIKVNSITNVSLVPPMYEQILDCAEPGELDSLRFVVLAGEKTGENLFKKSKEKCPAVLFINEYGPTEASVTAAARIGMDEDTTIIGTPIANARVYILDAYLSPVPVGVTGEICIAGAGVARGYLNQPELTAQKFLPVFYRSYRSYRTYSSNRIYKTGDLGCWLPDGTIRFIGRMDDQVKVRGFRIEPREIEAQLLEHAYIKQVVVIDWMSKTGDTYLCAYLVLHSVHSTPEPGALEFKEHLSHRLPGYMIPSYFFIIPELPLTTTGKIDRKRLPDPEDGEAVAPGEYVPPSTFVEKKLAFIWQKVLGRDEPGIHDDFFLVGGNSLKATGLISHINKEFNVKVPLQELFLRPTIKYLAEYIEGAEKAHYVSIEPAPQKEYYPTSSQQKRMYFLQQIDVTGTPYNCPMMIPLEGDIHRERLKDAFVRLIARHESLRTSFKMTAGQPVQVIHQGVEFEIEYHEGDENVDVREVVQGFVRPFDLSAAPLLRVGLVKQEEDRHLLMVDMHHVTADDASMTLIVKDFTALYSGETLPELRLQYKDYAEWQNSEEQKESVKQQEAYWLDIFKSEPPVLHLPTDYSRTASRSAEGNSVTFELEKEKTSELRRLAMEKGVTMFMLFLASYNVLLSKLSGQEEIVVGFPVAGRRHADIENIVGLFVNILALRNYPSGETCFSDFLNQLKENTLAAFENQDYQIEDLVERIVKKRDKSRIPLFDVMFQFIDHSENSESPGVIDDADRAQENHQYLKTTAHTKKGIDLLLSGEDTGKKSVFVMEYNTSLFKEETIGRFINYFKNILDSILEEPERKIIDIDILSDDEENRLLDKMRNESDNLFIKKIKEMDSQMVESSEAEFDF